jgi:hypothetical protein
MYDLELRLQDILKAHPELIPDGERWQVSAR